jgi:hypothetical protein
MTLTRHIFIPSNYISLHRVKTVLQNAQRPHKTHQCATSGLWVDNPWDRIHINQESNLTPTQDLKENSEKKIHK